MRILLVSTAYPPPPGGIQTVVKNLERGLNAIGHKVELLHVNPTDYERRLGDFLPRPRLLSEPTSLDPRRYTYLNAVERNTTEALDSFKPDLVHAMHIKTWPALRAAKGQGISTAVSTYGLELQRQAVAESAFETADGIHTISEFTASLIQRDHGRNPDAIIPPSIDIESFSSTKKPVEETDRGDVITISRFVKRKNIETVIKAWSRLEESVRQGRQLIVAGDGPRFKRIQELAARATDIILPGQINEDEKRDYLSEADLFVLPANGSGYDVEGFGIVFIEAQAAGVPVVGSTVGGVPEAVGEAGLLVERERDAVAVADAIETLLVDADIREKCILSADERIREFDIPHIAKQYTVLYDTIRDNKG